VLLAVIAVAAVGHLLLRLLRSPVPGHRTPA
jgi:hypothetical protein